MSDDRRLVEVDVLKAAGILAVILIHSLRWPWVPSVAPVETAMRPLLRFAVPAFLFASGYLYATSRPIPIDTMLRRFRRLLVPYLLASLAAQVFWELSSRPDPRTGSLWLDLLFGWSFGPYYYVFVILLFVLATPLLARVPRRGAGFLLLGLLVLQGLFETRYLPVSYRLGFRNPLLWAAYFYAGWWLRLHAGAVAPALGRRRWPLAGALLAAGAACFALTRAGLPLAAQRASVWALVYCTLGLLFTLGCGRRDAPAPLRALSDATYGIYLLHMFFVVGLQEWLRPARGVLDPGYLAALYAGGLGGPLLVIGLARRLLGAQRARAWVGA